MRLLADAVGQSLSTRPDIIGAEISKVRLYRTISSIFVFIYLNISTLSATNVKSYIYNTLLCIIRQV